MNFFRTLDWGPWLWNLLKGGISAGASSVTVMFSTAIVDPADFRIGSAKSLTVMAWSFGVSFAKYAFLFLQSNPLPSVKTVTKGTVDETTLTTGPK